MDGRNTNLRPPNLAPNGSCCRHLQLPLARWSNPLYHQPGAPLAECPRVEPRMDKAEVIHLRMGRVEDMFQVSESDVMSPQYRFEPGVDYCLSKLRSRRSRSPVRLEVELPATQLDADTPSRLRQTLVRYCKDRIDRNSRDGRIARLDGYSALKVGIPIALVGLAIAVATAVASTQDDFTLPNLAGWVLAWVGLWYPLDTILFSSVGPRRENAVLTRLQDAEVVVKPF
jgi:hypothetical protein